MDIKKTSSRTTMINPLYVLDKDFYPGMLIKCRLVHDFIFSL